MIIISFPVGIKNLIETISVSNLPNDVMDRFIQQAVDVIPDS